MLRLNQLMTSDIEMTSLYKVELVGEQHYNIMHDIRVEIETLGEEIGRLIFEPTERLDSQNKE